MSQEIITVFQLPFHKVKGIPYVLLLDPYGYLTFPQASGTIWLRGSGHVRHPYGNIHKDLYIHCYVFVKNSYLFVMKVPREISLFPDKNKSNPKALNLTFSISRSWTHMAKWEVSTAHKHRPCWTSHASVVRMRRVYAVSLTPFHSAPG